MSIASPHLPTRRPRTMLRSAQRRIGTDSSRRITIPRAHFATRFVRFDDRPGFERNASPSDLALRQISGVHSLHR